ncbi:MAG: preprotein translocase subunit SecG [Clostridia bacterium]|nr:preprotein translocase subunit SecG [Clostridia bacterium]
MAVLNVILSVLVIIAALFLIVTVLLQSGQKAGIGAVAGTMETFLGKNKAKTLDAKLALGTKIAATVFIVTALLLVIVG